MKSLLRRLWYSIMYWFSPPWDTGIPAPELVRAVAELPPGRAIDIGCGTGTNLLYLAQHGWQITGVDFVPRAVSKARAKLKSFSPVLLAADVTTLKTLVLPGPFDLALDMGCFHGLPPGGRRDYAEGLAHWMEKGSRFLLYAWQPESSSDSNGVPKAEVVRCFDGNYTLARYEQGKGRTSAWYYFLRK
jgi:SAM-dependent methyltransferase